MNISLNNNEPNWIDHPYRALMNGIPGVVALYLLDLNQEEIPYVGVYAPDRRRLNIQPEHLLGKPYDWHGISSGLRIPRAKAIDEFVLHNLDMGSYWYKYWDKGTLWAFDCRLVKLPQNYLLLVVADTDGWQKKYWDSSAQPLESVNSLIDDTELIQGNPETDAKILS